MLREVPEPSAGCVEKWSWGGEGKACPAGDDPDENS